MADTSTSLGAFLQGQDTALDSQSAYMEMGTIADDNQSAYMEGRSTRGYVFVGGDQVVVGTGNNVYVEQIVNTVSAYLWNDGSIQETSSASAFLEGVPIRTSQKAHIAGADSATDSIPAYLTGIPIRTSQPAYLEGFVGTPVSDSKPAFLASEVDDLDSVSAYLTGHPTDYIDDCEDYNTWASIGSLSNSTDAKQGTYSTQCSATTLAAKFYKGTFSTPYADTDPFADPCIHLWIHIPDVSLMVDSGQIEISSSGIPDNLELHWVISNYTVLNAYGSGLHQVLEDGWNELHLRLSSATATGGSFNGDVKYFRFAYTSSLNQIVRIDDVYVTEFAEYTSSISAYLNSLDGLAIDSKSAFMACTADDQDDISAYMFGGTTLHDSVSAYMFADAIPADSSTPAFVSGGTTVYTSQPAYMEMGTIAEDSAPAQIAGKSTSGAWQSCFLEGQHPRSFQDAFMTGQWAPTAKDSQSAFLEAEGAWPFEDDFTGEDESDWSEYLWFTESIDD